MAHLYNRMISCLIAFHESQLPHLQAYIKRTNEDMVNSLRGVKYGIILLLSNNLAFYLTAKICRIPVLRPSSDRSLHVEGCMPSIILVITLFSVARLRQSKVTFDHRISHELFDVCILQFFSMTYKKK